MSQIKQDILTFHVFGGLNH